MKYTLQLIVAAVVTAVVVSEVEIIQQVKVLVVLKVTQVGYEISLNRKHSSKIFMHPNMLALEWEKLVSGIKGTFITHYGRNRTV